MPDAANKRVASGGPLARPMATGERRLRQVAVGLGVARLGSWSTNSPATPLPANLAFFPSSELQPPNTTIV